MLRYVFVGALAAAAGPASAELVIVRYDFPEFANIAMTFGYFATTGHLQSIAGPSGVSLTFQRDGELITTTQWSGMVSGSVGRTYDTFRRQTTETVNGASSISFTYDDDGLVKTAGAGSARPAVEGEDET